MNRMANLNFDGNVQTVLNKEDIFSIRQEVNSIKLAEPLEKYIIDLVFASRFPKDYGMTDEAAYINFGASPRASINLNLASRGHAYLEGRDFVIPEDVKAVAVDVLNHRILLNYEAEADGVNQSEIVKSILEKVQVR